MIVLMCVCVIVRAVRCSILLPAWFLTTTLWCEEGLACVYAYTCLLCSTRIAIEYNVN